MSLSPREGSKSAPSFRLIEARLSGSSFYSMQIYRVLWDHDRKYPAGLQTRRSRGDPCVIVGKVRGADMYVSSFLRSSGELW